MMNIEATNTILYCKNWNDTVEFYQYRLGLEVLFSSDWFIEFSLTSDSRLSVADQNHASIQSSPQKGITISLQVTDIDSIWDAFGKKGLNPTPIKKHSWNANTFYIFDPEGHRIEIWESTHQ